MNGIVAGGLTEYNFSKGTLFGRSAKSWKERKTMRNIVANLIIGVTITTIVLGSDNLIGTWKHNIEKSKTTSPSKNPLNNLTVVIEAIGGGVKVTATGERQDGTPINGAFTAKYDGKEYPVTGAPWDTISMKQIDANHFTLETRKTGGNYHMTTRTVISKDGKTMTETFKGTNSAGQPTSGIDVYEKQ
jgi:hypothetical protein